MLLNLLMIAVSISVTESAIIDGTGCKSIPLSKHDSSVHVSCQGNFSDMETIRQQLESVSSLISEFMLEDALIDALPPDVFHGVPNAVVRKVIFDNVSLELLDVPELGEPPLKSIKNTVERFEIYNCPTVFAWNFTSLSFRNLKDLIVENSDLISISQPLSFWPDLQFIQFQNASLRWIHPLAFAKNRKIVICSLAHNGIRSLTRSMFPKPATKLYSLDLSFNKLEYFSEDMFDDMDFLHELKLDNNRLKAVSKEILRPVWQNLSQLWLEENGLRCEHLCWMNDRTDLPMFLEFSKCRTSRRHYYIHHGVTSEGAQSNVKKMTTFYGNYRGRK